MEDREFKKYYRKYLAIKPVKKKRRSLSEGITWENRKGGERLPTMKDYQEAYNKTSLHEAKMEAEEVKKGMLLAPVKYYDSKAEMDEKTIEVEKIEKDDEKDSGYKVTGRNISDGQTYGYDLNDLWEPKKIGFGRDAMQFEGPVEDFEDEEFAAHSASLGNSGRVEREDEFVLPLPKTEAIFDKIDGTIDLMETNEEELEFLANIFEYTRQRIEDVKKYM